MYLQSFAKKEFIKTIQCRSEIEFLSGDLLTIKEKPLSKDFE